MPMYRKKIVLDIVSDSNKAHLWDWDGLIGVTGQESVSVEDWEDRGTVPYREEE